MSDLPNRRRMLRRLCANFTLAFILLAGSGIASAASVVWGDWTFDYEVSGNDDGLSLRNVTFQGHTLVYKVSLPVMRVFYDNDVCGPFADRLGTLSQVAIPWANNALLAQRQFTLADEFNPSVSHLWYEIGIRVQLGSYDMYQVYYLSSDGIIDAHIYARGLQCITHHLHYPNWRIDLDVDGNVNDQIQRDTGTGFTTLTNEFDLNAATSPNHAWRVRDTVTGLYVDVLAGFTNFTIPPPPPSETWTTVPVAGYDHNTIFGRLFNDSEDIGWIYGPGLTGPNTQVPINNAESINGVDVVLWEEGYLPHNAYLANGITPDSNTWHSTGVRLVSSLVPNTPPPPPPVGNALSFTAGAVSIPDSGSANPYPSTIDVSGVTGTVSKITVELLSLSHTYPDDIDILLVGPTGQAVKLMSDTGGNNAVNNISITLDSTVSTMLPDSSQIISGTFKPTDIDVADSFPALAPISISGTDLSVFNNLSPNGFWKLYVIDDEANDSGMLAGGWKLNIVMSQQPQPVSNTFSFTGGAISIPNSSTANPYPSTIDVSGVTGTVSKVTVELLSLSHMWPDDIDMALVGPTDRVSKLMSDTGGGNAVNNISVTLDSTVSATLPDSTLITSGVFKPTNFGSNDSFPVPAPASARTSGANLSVFNSQAPNGLWKLYINDDRVNNSGSLATGWKLNITTAP